MEYTCVRIENEADMLAPTSSANWKPTTMVFLSEQEFEQVLSHFNF
jgi:hypothetical protein